MIICFTDHFLPPMRYPMSDSGGLIDFTAMIGDTDFSMPDAAEFVKPSIQAFLVCDQVICDINNGKKTIVGVFTHVRANGFPCRHSRLALYVCFTDAEGVYDFEIELVYLNQNQRIGRGRIGDPVTIKDRLAINDIGIDLPNVIFPGAGRYEFRLYAKGNFVASKDFEVVLEPGTAGVQGA